jgi:hypothetical protein
MRPAEWQDRRSELTHGWFKNRFMLALGKFSNLLNGVVRDDGWVDVFITDVLSQWPTRRADFELLISTFEFAMSPRALFSDTAMATCPEHTRLWLSELVHTLWSSRVRSTVLVTSADDAVRNADEAYRQLLSALPPAGKRSIANLNTCREPLVVFRRCCQELADSIATLPREVLFT